MRKKLMRLFCMVTGNSVIRRRKGEGMREKIQKPDEGETRRRGGEEKRGDERD